MVRMGLATTFPQAVNVFTDPDFDTMAQLSAADPQAFFAERTRLIEEFLSTVPPDRVEQLRQFQQQIDAMRISAGSPQKALAGLMGMLGDHLSALHGHTAQLAAEAQFLRKSVRPTQN